MSFLSQNWNTIVNSAKRAGTANLSYPGASLGTWNSDRSNLDMMITCLKLQKPQILIELGTFVGEGTKELCAALDSKASFYTIDAGTPVYEVSPNKSVTVDINTWNDGQYVEWPQVVAERNRNLDMIRQACPHIDLHYVEGITDEVLDDVLKASGGWDFCFQDSHHVPHLINLEFVILNKHARPGNIVVFDDIYYTVDYFNAGVDCTGWEQYYTDIGHKQIWMEKL